MTSTIKFRSFFLPTILALILLPIYTHGQSTSNKPFNDMDYLIGGTWTSSKPISIGGQEFSAIIEYRYKAEKNMIVTVSYRGLADGKRILNNEGFFIPHPEKEMVHYLAFPNGGVIEGDYRRTDTLSYESDFTYFPVNGEKSEWKSTIKKVSKNEFIEESYIFHQGDWKLQTKIRFQRK